MWIMNRGDAEFMKEHLENVAFMARNSCSLEELKPLIAIIGILHDIGKFGKRIRKISRIFWFKVMKVINMDWIILPQGTISSGINKGMACPNLLVRLYIFIMEWRLY